MGDSRDDNSKSKNNSDQIKDMISTSQTGNSSKEAETSMDSLRNASMTTVKEKKADPQRKRKASEGIEDLQSNETTRKLSKNVSEHHSKDPDTTRLRETLATFA